MVERDWQADWEMINKAFPLPYYSDGTLRPDYFSRVQNIRQALKFWLQRVRELEDFLRWTFDDENADLSTEALEQIKAESDVLDEMLEKAVKQIKAEEEERYAKLEEENRKLRDILGTVREYKDVVKGFIYSLHCANHADSLDRFYRGVATIEQAEAELDKALAALDGGEKEVELSEL